MAVNHVLLRDGKAHFHVLPVRVAFGPLDGLVIHNHFTGIEGNLPFHFPLHGFGQFRRVHLWHVNHAHDDGGLSRHAADNLATADAGLFQQCFHGLRQHLRINNDAVFKGFLGRGRDIEGNHLDTFAALAHLSDLDEIGTDVQTNIGAACHDLLSLIVAAARGKFNINAMSDAPKRFSCDKAEKEREFRDRVFTGMENREYRAANAQEVRNAHTRKMVELWETHPCIVSVLPRSVNTLPVPIAEFFAVRS